MAVLIVVVAPVKIREGVLPVVLVAGNKYEFNLYVGRAGYFFILGQI